MQSKARLDLWDALGVLRKRVLDQMQEGLASMGADLSVPQSLALAQIADAGPLTVTALQKRMKRSQATTSHLVTQLELKGLVERSDDPEDARRTLLDLSKEGRRFVRRLEQLRRDGFERVLGPVPAAVRRQLEEAVVATLDALERSS